MSLAQGTATRGEIITQALQRAANASRDLKAQARIRLNRILSDLAMGWDWPFLFVEAQTNLGGSSFPLPTDFLKTVDPYALRVTSDPFRNPISLRIVQIDPMAFTGRAVPVAQTSVYPTIWTVDYATSLGKFWPVPDTPLLGTLRYKRLPPDVDPADPTTYDADVPIFPWANYLTDVLLAWAMEYENDYRAAQQKQDNEAMFARIRAATFPPATASLTTGMGLDPDVFGTPWGGEGNWPSR